MNGLMQLTRLNLTKTRWWTSPFNNVYHFNQSSQHQGWASRGRRLRPREAQPCCRKDDHVRLTCSLIFRPVPWSYGTGERVEFGSRRKAPSIEWRWQTSALWCGVLPPDPEKTLHYLPRGEIITGEKSIWVNTPDKMNTLYQIFSKYNVLWLNNALLYVIHKYTLWDDQKIHSTGTRSAL